ncbi:phosphoenolpyruvate carboxylase, partial [Candidatus Bathyarchaeota archaeon]
YLRVFLARSDPALNYGLFSAVLLVKFALSKIFKLSSKVGLEIFPIIGAGSLPFRGHLTPQNIINFIEEYAGVRTVTIQSALKYDFSKEKTVQTINILNRELPRKSPISVDEKEERLFKNLIRIFASAYQSKIKMLSGIINYIASFVPARRARKLHIGLFGYSRKIGRIKLPRAIPFTAALYSLGLPPELMGVRALINLKENEWKTFENYYLNWKKDLAFASQFLNMENLNCLLSDQELEEITKHFGLKETIRELITDLEEFESLTGIKLGPRNFTHRKHRNFTSNVLISLAEGKDREVTKYIIEAGKVRCSLG